MMICKLGSLPCGMVHWWQHLSFSHAAAVLLCLAYAMVAMSGLVYFYKHRHT